MTKYTPTGFAELIEITTGTWRPRASNEGSEAHRREDSARERVDGAGAVDCAIERFQDVLWVVCLSVCTGRSIGSTKMSSEKMSKMSCEKMSCEKRSSERRGQAGSATPAGVGERAHRGDAGRRDHLAIARRNAAIWNRWRSVPLPLIPSSPGQHGAQRLSAPSAGHRWHAGVAKANCGSITAN
jgi:hypothetical protein